MTLAEKLLSLRTERELFQEDLAEQVILILLFFTGRACWRVWKKRKEDG